MMTIWEKATTTNVSLPTTEKILSNRRLFSSIFTEKQRHVECPDKIGEQGRYGSMPQDHQTYCYALGYIKPNDSMIRIHHVHPFIPYSPAPPSRSIPFRFPNPPPVAGTDGRRFLATISLASCSRRPAASVSSPGDV